MLKGWYNETPQKVSVKVIFSISERPYWQWLMQLIFSKFVSSQLYFVSFHSPINYYFVQECPNIFKFSWKMDFCRHTHLYPVWHVKNNNKNSDFIDYFVIHTTCARFIIIFLKSKYLVKLFNQLYPGDRLWLHLFIKCKWLISYDVNPRI